MSFFLTVTAFYGTNESVVRALVELNSTDDQALIHTIQYRIKDIVDNYEFYLRETNRTTTEVTNISVMKEVNIRNVVGVGKVTIRKSSSTFC